MTWRRRIKRYRCERTRQWLSTGFYFCAQYWLIVVIHLCMTKLCTEKTREPHMSSYAMNWKIILNLIDEAPVYFKCLSPHDYRPCHSERTQFEFVRVLPSQPHSSLRTYCSCQPYTNAQTHEECAHIQGRLYVCVLCGIGKCYTWMYLTQKGFLWVTHTVCTDFCYFLYCFWRENFEEIFATRISFNFLCLDLWHSSKYRNKFRESCW